MSDIALTVEDAPTIEMVLQGVTVQTSADLVDLTVTPTLATQTFEHVGHDGYDEVVVNAYPLSTQTKSLTVTQNGTQSVEPDSGYDGLAKVNITTAVPDPFEFGIPVFAVGTDGHLSVSSEVSAHTTDFAIDSNGHLILTTQTATQAFSIDSSGHLIYTV